MKTDDLEYALEEIRDYAEDIKHALIAKNPPEIIRPLIYALNTEIVKYKALAREWMRENE